MIEIYIKIYVLMVSLKKNNKSYVDNKDLIQ